MTPSVPRREVVGAWFLLLGLTCLLAGMMWDGQWHVDVGPDTFFTAPHLLLYASTAIVGLTCLTVVLQTSWSSDPPSSTPAVKVFRIFRAPWPFLLGGLGAAGNLLYGGADLWWHEVYGFDIAVAQTPSHVGLGWTWLVETVAVVMAFGVLRRTRTERWGLAIALAVAVPTASAPVTSIFELTLGWIPDVPMQTIGLGPLAACGIGLFVAVTRSARWTAAVGLASVVVLAVIAVFSLIATQLYADAIGQPVREYALGIPIVLGQYPPTFPAAAFITAGIVWWSVRRGWPPTTVLPALGALASLAVASFFVATDNQLNVIASVLVAAGLGAGLGWFGWHTGELLRQLGRRGQSEVGKLDGLVGAG